MNRSQNIELAKDQSTSWDILVIGGGATGLGVAVDAASRGFKTLLLEQGDFAQGTSSRSTKLVHGGVRYLQQGDVKLVVEALKERGLMRANAPHLVHDLEFVVPNYDWWEGPFYGIGLKMYDVLAGKLGLGPSKFLSKKETLEYLPTIEPKGLKGGIKYHDGQFDDARLAINLAQTASDHGASLINYAKVDGLLKGDGFVEGVQVVDQVNGDEWEVKAKVVINATGAFTDGILALDNPEAEKLVQPSQGIHLVTDLAVDAPTIEPKATDEEIDYLLEHIARYLVKDPERSDVLSVFAGLRPLVKTPGVSNTSSISREHALFVSNSGLVTIAGGKWTTYRKMAEDTINMAISVGDLENKACKTENLRIHGAQDDRFPHSYLGVYGSDAKNIQDVIDEDDTFAQSAHDLLSFKLGEIVWAVRNEMAITVTDVLSRRTRSLLLNAKASVEVAPKVAEIMAEEMGKDSEWIKSQIEAYESIADNYIVKT